jgi:hypothetical protein
MLTLRISEAKTPTAINNITTADESTPIMILFELSSPGDRREGIGLSDPVYAPPEPPLIDPVLPLVTGMPGVIDDPHSAQKRAVGETSLRHCGHKRSGLKMGFPPIIMLPSIIFQSQYISKDVLNYIIRFRFLFKVRPNNGHLRLKICDYDEHEGNIVPKRNLVKIHIIRYQFCN